MKTDNPLVELKRKPNQETIAHIEGLLEKAKTGELQGIINAVVWNDGESSRGWAGMKKEDFPKMLGEIFIAASNFAIQTEGVNADNINYD